MEGKRAFWAWWSNEFMCIFAWRLGVGLVSGRIDAWNYISRFLFRKSQFAAVPLHWESCCRLWPFMTMFTGSMTAGANKLRNSSCRNGTLLCKSRSRSFRHTRHKQAEPALKLLRYDDTYEEELGKSDHFIYSTLHAIPQSSKWLVHTKIFEKDCFEVEVIFTYRKVHIYIKIGRHTQAFTHSFVFSLPVHTRHI